ncbi:PadR family transcriptional regulator [Streptomyces sp. ICN441]|uniref:PadR family transcriptional regulator n=1 Tax=Streptomyces sp. ICN441 TaxID=2558286 RepID=UPI0010695793|nr:PadR family transcriptional regulator [Streptomyces sp. ICN441]TFE51836.1 PadR family transcriptional regulator [Streptomyces sp. ICN441]
MALRHAVLAALLDGESSGYQLAKAFDLGVANFWHALPQQLYLELAKLEKAGLVEGRQVVQQTRPPKRLFTITDEGLRELARFAETSAKPSFIRDDLMVKVQAADNAPVGPVVEQLDERAAMAAAKTDIFERFLRRLRGDLDEETFLATADRVGPYLTCLRGLRFEQETADWCARTAAVLRARQPRPAEGGPRRRDA